MRWTTLLVFIAAGCVPVPPPRPEPSAVPVLVAKAEIRTVPIEIRTIGTVKALATVAIRPRVSGPLTEVYFKEGEYVKKDQKLLGIDPRPYETAVKQAQATLARSEALRDGAALALKRLESAGGAGSGLELDIARTAFASANAVVGVDEAALESSKLQLSFTTIVAPLDGRVGELLVNIGNLVDPTNSAPLVVINQITPIAVTFALPEAQLPAVAAARRKGPLKVEAFLRDGEPPIPGTLAFIDNAVNIGSGTVQLKADFPNADRKLWPGQFVDVVLTIRERADSVVVPAAAVLAGQKGSYVYVVQDGQAKYRGVTVAFERGPLVVIASGLEAGETVATDGQLRLTDGTAVSVKTGAGAAK